MGKKIIIKGADFSENGIKSLNYVSGVYFENNNQSFRFTPNFTFENSKGKFTINFKCIGEYNYGSILQLFVDSSSTNPTVSILSRGEFSLKTYLYRLLNAEPQVTAPIAVGTSYNMVLDIASKTMTLNGTSYEVPYTTGTKLNSIMLLGGNGKEFVLSSLKYEIDGETKMELYAVLDDNNVPCLYDTIEDSYHYGSETPKYIP